MDTDVDSGHTRFHKEKCFLLVGKPGNKYAEEQIANALEKQQAKGQIDIFTPFYSHDVGLCHFPANTCLGLVRIHGDLLQLDEFLMVNELTAFGVQLQNLPVDVFGAAQMSLNKDSMEKIPDIRKELEILCEKLGLKLSLIGNNIWLVGRVLPVSIARCHLNRLHKKISSDLQFGPNIADVTKLSQLLSDTRESDIGAIFPTDFLFLYLYLHSKKKSLKDFSVAVNQKCSETKLFLHWQQGIINYKDTRKQILTDMEAEIQRLKNEWNAVYIRDHLEADYRGMMENILEKMHKPYFYVKCKQKQWSCYIYKNKTDSLAAEKFLSDYRKVNSVTSTETWWSSLSVEMKTTVDMPEPLVNAGSPSVNVGAAFGPDDKKINEKQGLSHTTEGHETSNKKSEEGSSKLKGEATLTTEVHPKTLATVSDITYDNVTYLCYHHRKEMQKILEEHRAKIILQKADVLVKASGSASSSAKSELLQLAHKGVRESHKDGVDISGPKEIVKQFNNAFEQVHGTSTEAGQVQKMAQNDNSSRIGKINGTQGAPGRGDSGSGRRIRALKDSGATAAKTQMSAPLQLDGMTSYLNRRSNIIIQVGKRNITELPVDAIVNAANENLDHIGGVARYIADAAGPGFEDECQESIKKWGQLKTGEVRVTSGGKMAAPKVLHAVGPVRDHYKNEEDAYQVLQDTFSEVLKTARNEGCKSVAMPAISSGSFGIPQDVVAAEACAALKKFFKSDKTEPLKTIIFVDVNGYMIELYLQEMDRLLKKSILERL